MEFLDLIDVGAYSRVFRVSLPNSQKIASKVIDVRERNDSIIEIDVMSRFCHPNLISKFSLVTQPNSFFLGINIPLANYTLTDIISKFDTNDMIKSLKDISAGLNFLHCNNIAHLDIKLDNILVFETKENEETIKTYKITDFGTAMIIRPFQTVKSSFSRITYCYCPPETKVSEDVYKFSQKTDVWSMGMVFLSILNKKYPFKLRDEASFYKLLHDKDASVIKINKTIKDKNMKNLLLKMMKKDPKNRISMGEVCKRLDSYVSGFIIGIPPLKLDVSLVTNKKIRSALKLYINMGNNLNPKIETFFTYFDIFYRSIKFFKPEDDLYLICASCFSIAYCLSTGDNLIPVETKNEQLIYTKYETFILIKLDGLLINSKLPSVSKNLTDDLEKAYRGYFSFEKEGIEKEGVEKEGNEKDETIKINFNINSYLWEKNYEECKEEILKLKELKV